MVEPISAVSGPSSPYYEDIWWTLGCIKSLHRKNLLWPYANSFPFPACWQSAKFWEIM